MKDWLITLAMASLLLVCLYVVMTLALEQFVDCVAR